MNLAEKQEQKVRMSKILESTHQLYMTKCTQSSDSLPKNQDEAKHLAEYCFMCSEVIIDFLDGLWEPFR